MNRFNQFILLIPLFCCLSINGFSAERTRFTFVSSADQSKQQAYLIVPKNYEAKQPTPLVVSLHTWSGDLEQRNKPLEELVSAKGWIYLFPNFRGPNKTPQACGSALAQQDILDSISFVKQKYKIDPQRIYLTGTSGGGHMTMLMAAKYPQVWSAASAWVGISDLTAWHAKHRGKKYGNMLEAACGGVPGDSEKINQQYLQRSPITYLRQAKAVALDLSAGVHDGHRGSVPITHTLYAFNKIAAANNTQEITSAEINQISSPQKRLTTPLPSDKIQDQSFGRKIYLRRHSKKTRVTIFEGGHEGIATATLAWFEKHPSKQ